jgi:hypothetical protein
MGIEGSTWLGKWAQAKAFCRHDGNRNRVSSSRCEMELFLMFCMRRRSDELVTNDLRCKRALRTTCIREPAGQKESKSTVVLQKDGLIIRNRFKVSVMWRQELVEVPPGYLFGNLEMTLVKKWEWFSRLDDLLARRGRCITVHWALTSGCLRMWGQELKRSNS